MIKIGRKCSLLPCRMGEFATAADRVNALRMLNGKELKGSKLSMKEMVSSCHPPFKKQHMVSFIRFVYCIL